MGAAEIRKPILIVGAGGLGAELVEYAQDAGREVAGLLDDMPRRADLASRVLGPIEGHQARPDVEYMIGVGDPAVRRGLAADFTSLGATFATLVHPLAYVARSASIGEGCVLAPFSFVGPQARLGTHVLMNTHSSVGHDATAEDCAVLSPYSVLNGNAVVEVGVFLGTNSAILPGVRIGKASKVAAGATVYKDAQPGSLVTGNPARARRLYDVD